MLQSEYQMVANWYSWKMFIKEYQFGANLHKQEQSMMKMALDNTDAMIYWWLPLGWWFKT